ncbi:MAG: vWA domain-containing protein [Phycisphaerae bacterium]
MVNELLSRQFAPGPVFGWVCLAAILLIPWVWINLLRNRANVAVRFSSSSLLRELGTSWVQRLRWLPAFIRSLAIVAIIVALARPQSAGAYRDTREGIAIQMVLDISGSMAQDDFLIDGQWVRRLDAVKRVFRDFVLGGEGLPGRENDLIGMSTFAMFAENPCPLTLDHGTLASILKETEIPGWVNGRQVREDQEADYTGLGDAIVLASDNLRRAGEQALAGVPGAEAAKSRVMILLTDGKDNPPPFRDVASAPDPIEAAKVAARLGVKIYTIGAVGDQRRQGGFFGRRGMQVDERALKEIAQTTGGKYFRATDTDSLITIYEEIDSLEKRSTGERSYRDNIYAARVAMIVALSLVLFEVLLVNTRFRQVP